MPQQMSAEIEVLRSTPASLPHRLAIHFVGRDGPDFSFCPVALPELEVGQTLLLPLAGRAAGKRPVWHFMAQDGYGMTTRVANQMRKTALPVSDGRSFIIREIVNSFASGDPVAIFTASSLVAQQLDYLDPDLTVQIEKSIGSDPERWAQILGSLLLTYPDRPLTIAEVQAGKTELDRPGFKGFPLAQLALRQLPSITTSELMVQHALAVDIPGFADEPYYPLFSYSWNAALNGAVNYLARYSEDSGFIELVRAGLRKGSPGFLFLAARLIDKGQRMLLPDALSRAIEEIQNPDTDCVDVSDSLGLLRQYGTKNQRLQMQAVAVRFRTINPDYAAFVQRRLTQ